MNDDDQALAGAAALAAFDAEPLAQWHGSVSGLLCGAPLAVAEGLLANLPHPDGSAPALDAVTDGSRADTVISADLRRVVSVTVNTLEEGGLDFQPLISDEVPLSERALGLAEWCQGFLYGLASTVPKERLMDDALGELLGDFAEIARAVRGGDDAEEAENAYVELVEFVRVGVQLCYEELRRERAAWANGPSETLQ
ncbi:MAG: UPF0149 family protein [Pseudomonadota bacterium]